MFKRNFNGGGTTSWPRSTSGTPNFRAPSGRPGSGGGGDTGPSQAAIESARIANQPKTQIDQRRQLAETMQQAGMVAGSSISGHGLWKTAPKGTTDPKVLEYLKNPNVYYTTYGPDTSAYSTAFQKDLTGYGGLVYSDPNITPDYTKGLRGRFTPFNPANYPDEYPGFGDGYNYSGDYEGDWWGGSGGGGGRGGGGGGYQPPEKFMPRGQANEAWGPQNPLQQAMINVHGGQGFQQGFARGGIVSLVT